MGNYSIFLKFENPRRGRQARNFTENAPKILDLKSSSEQIIFRKLSLGAPVGREGVRINALKRCPRLAEVENDCCAYSVFNYIPDLHGRETRVAVAGK